MRLPSFLASTFLIVTLVFCGTDMLSATGKAPLDKPVVYDGFQFSPPKEWSALSPDRFQSEVVKKVAASVNSSTTWIPRPIQAFESKDSSLCVVSYLEPKTPALENQDEPARNLASSFQKQFKKLGAVDRNDLTSNGLSLYQLRVVMETMVILKTIFLSPSNRMVQIDLYVPRGSFDTQKESVSRSLLSLSASIGPALR